MSFQYEMYITPLLVLTYNFATAIPKTTSHKLQTLTSTLQMVSKPQNCELKQEPRTLATELNQPLKFRNRERKYFFRICRDAGMGWNCSKIVTSRRIFVLTLNRASALTVEGNDLNFLLPLHIVANHRRIGLESKQTACFDLQFCHCHHRNHIPQIANTYIHTTNGLLISKL